MKQELYIDQRDLIELSNEINKICKSHQVKAIKFTESSIHNIVRTTTLYILYNCTKYTAIH